MDDLIDRQAAILAVEAMQTYKLSEDDDMLLVDQAEVMTVLMMLTPARPEITLESAIDYLHSIGWMQEHDRALTERKTGRWMFDRLVTTSGCFYGVRRCSECGMIGGGTRYCPYCGTDMKGGNDETD